GSRQSRARCARHRPRRRRNALGSAALDADPATRSSQASILPPLLEKGAGKGAVLAFCLAVVHGCGQGPRVSDPAESVSHLGKTGGIVHRGWGGWFLSLP